MLEIESSLSHAWQAPSHGVLGRVVASYRLTCTLPFLNSETTQVCEYLLRKLKWRLAKGEHLSTERWDSTPKSPHPHSSTPWADAL